MKTLNLQEMEIVQGGGLLRECMLSGATVIVGIAAWSFGGYWVAFGAIAHAANIGCFDY